MSGSNDTDDTEDTDDLDSIDSIDSIENGIEALLSGAQFLRDAVLAGESARITVPIAQEMCQLLRLLCDHTEAQLPDLVPDLVEAEKYLDQSIRLIDGGFRRSMVHTQMQNMIDLLEELV